MNLFFKHSSLNNLLNKKFLGFKKNDLLMVKYFDQYKFIHTIEGRCIQKRKTKKGDTFVSIYVKTKNMYFSFFQLSPLIVSVLKKKI